MKTYNTLQEKMRRLELDGCIIRHVPYYRPDGWLDHSAIIINKVFEENLDVEVNILSQSCSKAHVEGGPPFRPFNIYSINVKAKHVEPLNRPFASARFTFHSNAPERLADYSISIEGIWDGFVNLGKFNYREDMFDYDSDGVLLGMNDDAFQYLCSKLVSEQFLSPFLDLVKSAVPVSANDIDGYFKEVAGEEIATNIMSL